MAYENSLVRAQLEARLAAVSGLPEVVWTDVPRDPDNTTPYILGTFIVSSKRPLDNLMKADRGLLQLDVRYPIAQDADCEALAALIEQEFPATGQRLTLADGRTHIEYAQALNGSPDGSYWKVPVVVSWISYHT